MVEQFGFQKCTIRIKGLIFDSEFEVIKGKIEEACKDKSYTMRAIYYHETSTIIIYDNDHYTYDGKPYINTDWAPRIYRLIKEIAKTYPKFSFYTEFEQGNYMCIDGEDEEVI